MQASDFNAIVEAQFEACKDMLGVKAGEYADDRDRLHNFKIAAALEPNGTPIKALAGFMRKHTISIYDMCYSDEEFDLERWDEKINDSINYLLLLKACVVEEKFTDDSAVFFGIDDRELVSRSSDAYAEQPVQGYQKPEDRL